MSTLKNWILATRPKTLVASLIPVLCGSCLAFKATPLNFYWQLSLYALLSTLCIQIGTNLINDAIDFYKGADTAERLGPTRVSQMGLVSPKNVYIAGLIFFLCAMLFGIPLVLAAGWPIVVIGILSIICGYCYTGGPYPIAYNGLGEIFVFLFFGFSAICGTYFLHMHRIDIQSIVLSLQIGALASVILAVNNYRDIFTDKKVQKMTLAARFGKTFARVEIFLLYMLVYALNLYWFFEYGTKFFLALSVTILFAIVVVYGIFKNEPSKKINKFLGLSALTELLFGLSISLSFIFLT